MKTYQFDVNDALDLGKDYYLILWRVWRYENGELCYKKTEEYLKLNNDNYNSN